MTGFLKSLKSAGQFCSAFISVKAPYRRVQPRWLWLLQTFSVFNRVLTHYAICNSSVLQLQSCCFSVFISMSKKMGNTVMSRRVACISYIMTKKERIRRTTGSNGINLLIIWRWTLLGRVGAQRISPQHCNWHTCVGRPARPTPLLCLFGGQNCGMLTSDKCLPSCRRGHAFE